MLCLNFLDLLGNKHILINDYLRLTGHNAGDFLLNSCLTILDVIIIFIYNYSTCQFKSLLKILVVKRFEYYPYSVESDK